MATLTLSQVESKIADLVDNPKPNYKVGSKSFSWSQYKNWLLELRRELIANPTAADAGIEIMAFDISDVNEFGIDSGQYLE